jgi:hypothetical protein
MNRITKEFTARVDVMTILRSLSYCISNEWLYLFEESTLALLNGRECTTMRPQSQFKYRIHSRLNTGVVLGGTIYGDNGIGAALKPTSSSLTTWRLVADSKNALAFTLRPTDSGYDDAFLTWIADKNGQIWMGDTVHSPDGLTAATSLFYFEDADWQWVNYPDRRAPDGFGWTKIRRIGDDNSTVVDASYGSEDGAIVTSSSWDGGNSQQWWVERVG